MCRSPGSESGSTRRAEMVVKRRVGVVIRFQPPPLPLREHRHLHHRPADLRWSATVTMRSRGRVVAAAVVIVAAASSLIYASSRDGPGLKPGPLPNGHPSGIFVVVQGVGKPFAIGAI